MTFIIQKIGEKYQTHYGKKGDQSLDGNRNPKKATAAKNGEQLSQFERPFYRKSREGLDDNKPRQGQLGEGLNLCFTPSLVITVASVRLC